MADEGHLDRLDYLVDVLIRRSGMITQVKFDVLQVFAAAAVYCLVFTIQRWLECRFDPVARTATAKTIAPIQQTAFPR